MKKSPAFLAAALLALLSGPVMADAPITDAYMPETPQISGTIVKVNDRQIALDASDGQRILLAYDSHSVVPRDLSEGMLMSAEFRVMENGNYYAQRIVPARPTNGESSTLTASNSYEPTGSVESTPAAAEPAAGSTATAYDDAARPADAAREQEDTEDERVASTTRNEYDDDALPQTASHQPFIVMLGLLLVGAAGAVAIVRSRHGI